MEKVKYRITLDAQKSGVQRVLQGFETADKFARQFIIRLTFGGTLISLGDNASAIMYVSKSGASESSDLITRSAEVEGDEIIYNVQPEDYDHAGTTVFQVKVMSSSDSGDLEKVLASAQFEIDASASLGRDDLVRNDDRFTILEDMVAKATFAYDHSVKSVTINDDYTLVVTYRDGTIYESDSWKGLNDSIKKSEESARSDANLANIRANEAANSANAAENSATLAAQSKNSADNSADEAAQSAANSAASALVSKEKAENAELSAGKSAGHAKSSFDYSEIAKAAQAESEKSRDSAKTYAESSASSADNAKTSADRADNSADEAAQSAANSAASALVSKEKAENAELSAGKSAGHAKSSFDYSEIAKAAQAESEKSRDSAKTYAESSASSADNAKTSADRADNAADRAAASAKEASLEERIRMNYAVQRTGKVYQTKLYKFEANPTSTGEKLLDNAGLEWEPSTDTVVGVDDYANIPLFRWQNVNYVRDEDGSPRPIAIEGDANYKTSGSVDVGVMQMSFYWKWDTSDPEYDLITISDSPHEELGLVPWSECIRADGSVMPWCIGSKYFSGIAADGFLRSQPGLPLAVKQSYNNIQDNYAKKGAGYHGAGNERNTFQIIFIFIKGATKNSQSKLCGCTNYNYQYKASIQRSEKDIYFPVTNAQAANIEIGSRVYVGYGAMSGSSMTTDRGYDSMKKYADMAKVLRIEELDDSNKAIYLDVAEGFDTTPVQIADGVLSDIYISTMGWAAGDTDTVIGHHDGSAKSNLSGRHPYRVQGREYAVGSYFVSSDTVICFNEDLSKTVYVAEKGIARSKTDSIIKATYRNAGMIPALNRGEDFWIGDIDIDMQTGVSFPSKVGSSNSQGMADRYYAGGSAAAGTIREYLTAGNLWDGSNAGVACLVCWNWLGNAWWSCGGCD